MKKEFFLYSAFGLNAATSTLPQGSSLLPVLQIYDFPAPIIMWANSLKLAKTFLALRNSHKEGVHVLFYEAVMPESIADILWPWGRE